MNSGLPSLISPSVTDNCGMYVRYLHRQSNVEWSHPRLGTTPMGGERVANRKRSASVCVSPTHECICLAVSWVSTAVDSNLPLSSLE